MRPVAAARIVRVAWRTLWERKPEPDLWPPRPIPTKVLVRREINGQEWYLLPQDTMDLTIGPLKPETIERIRIECR